MQSTISQPTLETERLVLRPFVQEDARLVQRLCSDFAIADTTLNIPHPYEDGMAEAWISSHEVEHQAGSMAIFAVVEREGGQLCGAVGCSIQTAHDSGELGYWIAADRWSRGYATEAGGAMLSYLFEHSRLHRVEARHLVRNPASGRVMQKLGMRAEGVLREAVKKWGRYEDVAQYGILRREWLGRDLVL
jgi:ribosomal-protein-alanine N-acetyltransferase